MTSREITVIAQWQWRTPAYRDDNDNIVGGKWFDSGDPETLRAKLGPERLTVWLPSGIRVVCRRVRIPTLRERERKFYSHFGGVGSTKNRIIFTIPDEVTL